MSKPKLNKPRRLANGETVCDPATAGGLSRSGDFLPNQKSSQSIKKHLRLQVRRWEGAGSNASSRGHGGTKQSSEIAFPSVMAVFPGNGPVVDPAMAPYVPVHQAMPVKNASITKSRNGAARLTRK